MSPAGSTAAIYDGRRLRLPVVAFVAALLTASAVVNALTVISNRAHLGDFVAPWQPFCWEFSSHAMIGALIPVLVWFYRRVPVTRRSWSRTLPLHAAATVPYSAAHVAGMVALRKLVYAALGQRYEFGALLPNWLYEYRKDAVGYVVIVAAIAGFRAYRLSRAPTPIAARPGASEAPVPVKRLIARKLGREFVLNVADIDRIEANGNYVTLFAEGRAYPLRESLASLERRLDPKRFARVHRSHVVNVDRVREIRPWDSGDYRIVLHDGSEVKLSRRYRGRLGRHFGA